MKSHIYILFLMCFLCVELYAQEPAKQVNQAGFRSEWFGGLQLHSAGWGGTLTRAKFKNYKQYNLFSLDFVTIKHPKEFKVLNPALESAKSYKYGKLNGFMQTRLGYGRRFMLFEKFREKGVEIYFSGQFGANLGILKPIYLEIIAFDNNGNPIQGTVSERYDPIKHNELNIYGKSSSFKGLGESDLIYGGFLKASFSFEFAKDREKILALETGLVADIYPQKVPIMAFQDNQQVFINLFINILFGRKYYD